ncbi:zinc-type alcohol dehydrogenase-like protein C16A3.02c [Aspergillus lentulus]|uniref:Zinc-type alcohol dehydrogenase-like protein C16A3.02c n=1 Tax=Aspergillus lentulus TaxID=293939 RepID=A0AAN4T6V8_ASPLE|nr:zinc-type alcohol dehydrogenase-like protein C16A3.02c [Aspergillus lentulus]
MDQMDEMDHPSTMKAWLYTSTTGGLEKNLELSTSARTPGPPGHDQLLIKVISASINPADYKVPEMPIASRFFVTHPATPGMDFCGKVVTAGPGVTAFQPGQLVYGTTAAPTQFGSLGEYLLCKAGNVALLPDGVAPDHAATVGVAAQTAYQSIAPYVSPGDKVFINGGSGGCGIFAIQIAKALGCTVTTTCSTRNVQFCKDLGADEVIDYTQEDVLGVLRARGQVYAHVVDHIGLPDGLYAQSHAFLLPGKAFVQVGAVSMLTFVRRVAWPGFLGGGKRKYVIFMLKSNKEDIKTLGEWMQQGKLRVEVDSTYELEDAVKAFEKLRSGRARGKVIIHVSTESK